MLSLPAPFPEEVIGRDPVAFWDRKTAPGTRIKPLDAFDPRALHHYRTFFSDPRALSSAAACARASAALAHRAPIG